MALPAIDPTQVIADPLREDTTSLPEIDPTKVVVDAAPKVTVPIRPVFDPEGPGYDMDTAEELIAQWPLTIPKPAQYQGDYVTQDEAFEAWVWHPDINDYVKHQGSLDPRTGMVLKGRQSSTWDLTEAEETRLGSRIVKRDGRYYSEPIPRLSAGTEKEYNLLEKGIKKLFDALGKPSPLAKDVGISEKARARAAVELTAKERGETLAEFRESPELIEQMAQGFTDIASFGLRPAFESALAGEEPIPATDKRGKVGAGLGQLMGLLFGPAPVAKTISKPVFNAASNIVLKSASRRLPNTTLTAIRSSRAAQAAIGAIREAIHLAPAFALMGTGEALQTPTFNEAAGVMKEGLKHGAVTGAIFGMARGLFPQSEQQRVARIITGIIGLNAARIAENPQEGLPWNRPLEDVVFDTAMDVFFLWNGMPITETGLVAQSLAETSKRTGLSTGELLRKYGQPADWVAEAKRVHTAKSGDPIPADKVQFVEVHKPARPAEEVIPELERQRRMGVERPSVGEPALPEWLVPEKPPFIDRQAPAVPGPPPPAEPRVPVLAEYPDLYGRRAEEVVPELETRGRMAEERPSIELPAPREYLRPEAAMPERVAPAVPGPGRVQAPIKAMEAAPPEDKVMRQLRRRMGYGDLDTKIRNFNALSPERQQRELPTIANRIVQAVKGTDANKVQEFGQTILETMDEARVPDDIRQKIQVLLKPTLYFRDYMDNEAALASLQAHIERGTMTEEAAAVLDVMTDGRVMMLVSMKIDNLTDLKDTSFHEIEHVFERWLFPDDVTARLRELIPNMEDRADAMAEYFMDPRSKASMKQPNWLRQLWENIRNFLIRLKDKFVGAGRLSADDIFGRVEKGVYKTRKEMSPEEKFEAQTTGSPAPVWRSQMRGVIDAKLPGAGSPQQFIDTLNSWAKKGQIKAEELEWSGLTDWLSKQEGKVTKQDVLTYLEENSVQVVDVVRGRPPEPVKPVEPEPGTEVAEVDTDAEEQMDRIQASWEDGESVIRDPEDWYVEEEYRYYVEEYIHDWEWAQERIDEAIDERLEEEGYDFRIADLDVESPQRQFTITGEEVSPAPSPEPADMRDIVDQFRTEVTDELTRWDGEIGREAERMAEESWFESDYSQTYVRYNAESGWEIHTDYDENYYEIYDDRGNFMERIDGGDMAEAESRAEGIMISEGVLDGELRPRGERPRTTKTRWSEYTLPGGTNYQEWLLEVKLPIKSEQAPFRIPVHWGEEENVLLHVRTKDRVGPNGEKVLFIEELQSDWHQQGRETGYRRPASPEAIARLEGETENKYDELTVARRNLFEWEKALAIDPTDPPTLGENAELDAARNMVNTVDAEYDALRMQLDVARGEAGVPDAPFKSSWSQVALKRMARRAAEEGYDIVAWTPGIVHADRWNMARHVQQMRVNENGVIEALSDRGKIEFQVNPQTGNVDAPSYSEIDKKPLDLVVGKDLAKRIMESKPTPEQPDIIDTKELVILSDKGEGMTAFYDKILPAAVNKFFNKPAWGNAKVREIVLPNEQKQGEVELHSQLPNGEVWSIPVTDEMKVRALAEGMPMFQMAKRKSRTPEEVGTLPEGVVRLRDTASIITPDAKTQARIDSMVAEELTKLGKPAATPEALRTQWKKAQEGDVTGDLAELYDTDSQIQFSALRKEATKAPEKPKKPTTKERRAAPYAEEYQPARVVNTNEDIMKAREDLGPVIKHRTTKYKKRDGTTGTIVNQPMFRDEYVNQRAQVQEIPGITFERPLGGWLETAPRTFDQMGPWAKEFYYRSMLKAAATADAAIKEYRAKIKEWQKSLPRKSGERIGAYAISRQNRGKEILKLMEKEIPTLTKEEMAIYHDIRKDLNRFYNQIQKARRMSGKRPFPKQDNYFTFMRKLTLLERMGFSAIDVKPELLALDEASIAGMEKIGYNPRQAKMIEKKLKERAKDPDRIPITEYAAQFIKMKATPFKYEKARAKAGAMPIELDAFKVLDRYSTAAAKHIHMSPTISKLRESLLIYKPRIIGKKGAWQLQDLATGKLLPEIYTTKRIAEDAADGKSWALADNAPRAATFISDWLNDASGAVTPSKVLPATAERAMRKLNENMLYSYLSYSFRSAAIQLSALRGALTELGPVYAARGAASLGSLERIRFALENSNHLSTRQFDVMVEDMHSLLKRGKVGEVVRKTGKVGMGGLQFLDMAAAIATFNGAHSYAINKLGLTGDQARNFADDMTIKTQASAAKMDRSPAQRTLEGKLLSMFQTFTINEWNWITRDVMGIGNPNVSNAEAFKKVLLLITSTTLFNMLFEDGLGMDSPFPTPVRAYRESKARGEDTPAAIMEAAKEMVQQLPFLGGLRYGTGIGPPIQKDINQFLKGSPELAARVLRILTKMEMGDSLSYDERKSVESLFKLLGVPMTSQGARSIRAYLRGEGPWGVVAGTYTPEEEQTREQKKRAKERKGKKKSKGGKYILQ